MAQFLALWAESRRNDKNRQRPFTPNEFLPWVERPRMTGKAFRAAFSHMVKKKKGG